MLGSEEERTKTLDRVLLILVLTLQTFVCVVVVTMVGQMDSILQRAQPVGGWRTETTERLTTLDERLERIEEKLGLRPPQPGK